ncbi:hypothetical protein [Pyrobaculum sp.]|uniref:hypothetical protein n=1 Tax=Pyrobaculum sp. TaxID=2004705 RepID=UPI003170F613
MPTSVVVAILGAYFSTRRFSQAATSVFLIILLSAAFVATSTWPNVKAIYAAYTSYVPKGASYLGLAIVAAVAAPFFTWLAEYARTARAKILPVACPEDVLAAQPPPLAIPIEARRPQRGRRERRYR